MFWPHFASHNNKKERSSFLPLILDWETITETNENPFHPSIRVTRLGNFFKKMWQILLQKYPKYLVTYWVILKNCSSYFLGIFWKICTTFDLNIWSHCPKLNPAKNISEWGAAVAQWIRSRHPSCRPGFKSQAHHLRFFQFKFEFKLEHIEKTKINTKRGRDWPIFEKEYQWEFVSLSLSLSWLLFLCLYSNRAKRPYYDILLLLTLYVLSILLFTS